MAYRSRVLSERGANPRRPIGNMTVVPAAGGAERTPLDHPRSVAEPRATTAPDGYGGRRDIGGVMCRTAPERRGATGP